MQRRALIRTCTAAAVPALAGAAWLARRRASRQRPQPGRSVIVSAPKSTLIAADGAVRSVQSARLTVGPTDMARLWTADNLENLGATYWAFLTKATLGTVRVIYGEHERRVALAGIPALTLLRFDTPQFELHSGHAQIRWQIQDGLLVARRGRGQGWLSLDVKRVGSAGGLAGPPADRNPLADERPAGPRDERADGSRDERPAGARELVIEVEVANFYPSIASWLGEFAYEVSQSFVHVLVTHAFLRSLASLRLSESKVRKLTPA